MSRSTVLLWHQVALLSKVHVITKGHVDILVMLSLKAKLMSVVYAITKCQVDVSDLFSHHRSCDISVYVTSLACLSPWRYCNTDEDITKDHANLCGLYHHLKPWWCTWSMLLHEFLGWTPTVDHIDICSQGCPRGIVYVLGLCCWRGLWREDVHGSSCKHDTFSLSIHPLMGI